MSYEALMEVSQPGLMVTVRLKECAVTLERGQRMDLYLTGVDRDERRIDGRLVLPATTMARLAEEVLGRPKDTEISALYWGDGDWTCSFECGALEGDKRGWFANDGGDDAEARARTYWEADDSPTFSVFHEHDLELVPDGATCERCGKVLKP